MVVVLIVLCGCGDDSGELGWVWLWLWLLWWSWESHTVYLESCYCGNCSWKLFLEIPGNSILEGFVLNVISVWWRWLVDHTPDHNSIYTPHHPPHPCTSLAQLKWLKTLRNVPTWLQMHTAAHTWKHHHIPKVIAITQWSACSVALTGTSTTTQNHVTKQ